MSLWRGEAWQIARPAGLWPGSAQPMAAEGLGANDSADLIAVNVEIAHIDAAHDLLHPIINAAVKPESEAIAARRLYPQSHDPNRPRRSGPNAVRVRRSPRAGQIFRLQIGSLAQRKYPFSGAVV